VPGKPTVMRRPRGVLVIEINDRLCEEVDGLQEASLAAIRPQLIGAIAEAADRVLAQKEGGV
jgi:hypothetical protein